MSTVEQVLQDLEIHGFSVIKNVIEAPELLKISGLFNQEFTPAKVGKVDGAQRVEEVRGDLTHWLDPANPPKELSSIMNLLGEIKASLNSQLFMGLKDFECHLSKYPAGTFYKKHTDRFEKDSSRSISFIFYLHEEWTNTDGGELLLYNKTNEVLEMILPKPGSMVIFLSEKFPHEVKKCLKERRSLTGWMHTKLLT